MSKYIDADRLRAEIERRKGYISVTHFVEELLSLIDSLQQEQPCKGYDEAYLNEKIAKASKTWKGVDVDKYMAEMRGYEQPSEDLEEAAEKEYPLVEGLPNAMNDLIAHRQVAFKKGVKWHKEQMLKNAVEGVVIDLLGLQIKAPLNAVIQREGLKEGDKVKIVIVKEDKK